MDMVIYKFVCENEHIKVVFEDELNKMTEVPCHSCSYVNKKENGEKKVLKDELSHLSG